VNPLTSENGVASPATALLNDNAEIFQTLKQSIQEAQSEILIACGYITDQEIISLLGDKASKGVAVRLIVSDKPVNRIDLLKKQSENGLELHIFPTNGRGMMHSKFMIFDRKKACSGSYNLTRNAREYNKEQLIISYEQQIIDGFVKDFDQMIQDLNNSNNTLTEDSTKDVTMENAVRYAKKEQKPLPSFQMPNPASEPYTGFASELERLIHGEMGDFDRTEMHQEGYDHAKLANGHSKVLTKAMDSLYQQFKNSIEVNDGKILSIGTRLKSYTAEKKAFLSDQSHRKEKSNLMDLEGYEKQLIRSIQSNELEMKALNTAIEKKQLVNIEQLEAENKSLVRIIKSNELEFVKPPINLAELILYSTLGVLAMFFIFVFYTSAGYIWLFSAKDAQVALDMGFALDVPEVFDPKWSSKVKAYGLNGLIMV
jgi:translation initiation factor 2B subunit (eIF-2B alpha/beta/delta family)